MPRIYIFRLEDTQRPTVWVNPISPTPAIYWPQIPDHVLAPDFAFISNERLNEIGESDGFAQGAPDIAVEVISPNDRYTEVEEKVEDWLNAGCRAVIVVNPRRQTVNLHRSPTDVTTLTESDTLEISDIVPGWRMPIGAIFE